MTAEGKVTAARLEIGDRVMLKRVGDERYVPSDTKRKDAVAATVTLVRPTARGRRTGRAIWFRIDGMGLFEQRVATSASQTFWREP